MVTPAEGAGARPRRPRLGSWAGSHVVVTGGSSGIGRAFVGQVVGRGAKVSVLALDDADLEAVGDELRGRNARFELAAVDVTDRPAVQAAVDRVSAVLGPCDLLLTCAGVAHPGYFEQLDDEIFRQMMEVDYFGTLHAVRAVVPDMIRRRSGSVVGISSAAGLVGVFGYTAYGPAKFAVRGLFEALRAELRPYGIHVGCVCPPDTDTPQLAYENRFKPDETRAISGTIKPFSADQVAASIVRGVERGRFLITPDWQTWLVARTAGLAQEAYFGFFDSRVRSVRRRSGAASPQATRPVR